MLDKTVALAGQYPDLPSISLQATYIRNAIIHALREPLVSSGSRLRLPNSFVYNNPTISALASYILSLFSSNEQSAENNRERIAKSMQVMVSKYGGDFPVHNPHGAHEAKTLDEVVLVSGTSGRLGAHLLAQLLVKPSVTRVYALNRPSKQNILERQLKAFENWELDERLLAGGKVVLLEVDFTKADFGVGETVYNEVCSVSLLWKSIQDDHSNRCATPSPVSFTMVSSESAPVALYV